MGKLRWKIVDTKHVRWEIVGKNNCEVGDCG